MTESTNPPEASSTPSEVDSGGHGGTAPEKPTLGGISDEQLPEDLRPGDDNPLAEPLDPDDENTKSREELGVLDDPADSPDSDGSQGTAGTSGG